jgi:hypothetical protein
VNRLACVVFGGTLLFSPAAAVAQAPKSDSAAPNADAQTLMDFKARIDAYVKMREQADNTAKPQKQTAEPADIKEAQMSLAERIGVARKGAKPGDIFTPPIASLFKRLLRPESKETGTKAVIHEDNPGAGVPFKINAPYPDTEPLSTVPANVLEALPQLPADIEYRFVQKHLILRDTRANLIIDYLSNAIP